MSAVAPRRRGRTVLAGTAVLLLVAGLGVAGFAGYTRFLSPAEGAAEEAPSGSTATVERRTLADTEQVSGTLEYDDSFDVVSSAQGTLTELPEEGSVLKQGDVAYRVDDVPVILLTGSTPMWRPLDLGSEDAKDVRLLERNLKEMGYDPGTVDQDFTESTQSALYDFQSDHGLEETGTADPADFVITPGKIRIGAHQATLGQQVGPGGGAGLYQAASTDQVVAVGLDPDSEALAKVGATATVTLPSGKEAKAKITSVGALEQSTGNEGETTSVIPITLTLDDPKLAEGMSLATVSVDLTSETKKNVLTVPVTALVALAEGGFGVQLVTGDTETLTGVEVGLYADGYVEITAGLAEGDTVAVPDE
ncbi:peptidoglycan-binding protein [Nocardioides sp. CCNWLW239]|uniref:efflux RND transporter periplasmic adaptor subunit n=1 Tax=Nocardioides sp. CCNWLW239 TaxID=3128902 RepID=UPI003019C38C